jgi:hypothetical protein
MGQQFSRSMRAIADEFVLDNATPHLEPAAAERLRDLTGQVDQRVSVASAEDQVTAEFATRYLLGRLSMHAGPNGKVDVEALNSILNGLCPGFWPFC